MGYYSHYVLSVYDKDGNDVSEEEFRKHEAEIIEHTGDSVSNGETPEDWWAVEHKWYESSTDMQSYSLKYPDLIFNLHATGEEGERCNYYYRNGEEQVCDEIINYPGCKWLPQPETIDYTHELFDLVMHLGKDWEDDEQVKKAVAALNKAGITVEYEDEV